jgi:hypothetical protein
MGAVDGDRAYEAYKINHGMVASAAVNDSDVVVRAARLLRYWAERFESGRPGDPDPEQDLAPYPEPDLVALRAAIRQSRHLLGPLGDWRWTGATLLSRISAVPELAAMAAQAGRILGRDAMHVVWSPDLQIPAAFERQLQAHRGRVTFCVMAPDGRWLTTCGPGRIACWDTATGEEQARIDDPRCSDVESACAPSAGSWLAALHRRPGPKVRSDAHGNGVLRVWQFQRDRAPLVLDETARAAYKCAISPNERYLICFYHGNEVRFWPVASFTWDPPAFAPPVVIRGLADPYSLYQPVVSCYPRSADWFALVLQP